VGGDRLKLPGPGGPEGGLGLIGVAYFFFLSFPVVSSIIQTDHFTSGLSHSATLTVSLSDLVQIFLADPP
jgi:hypothetical protein